MKKYKNAVKVLAFLIVFLVVLIHVQELVTPDYNFPEYDDRLGNAVRGLYKEPKDSLQVLWLGTSHMRNGVSPMVVYRESGLRSYNLSSPSQTVGVAYERLREALKNQSPKAVFVDVSFCFYSAGFNKNEVPWRKVIDSLHWSRIAEKYRMTKGFVDAQDGSMTDVLDGVLPIVRYHSHYLLDEKDYNGNKNDEEICFVRGYGFSGRMQPVEDYDYDSLETFSAQEASRKNKNVTSRKKLERSLKYDYQYLQKMADLCKAHDCELILTKVPVRANPETFQSYWSREKHDMISEAAQELGCRFVDLHYEDVDLDWQTDSKDAGHHLNMNGALKVSKFYADWLLENIDFGDSVDASVKVAWDAQLRLYEREEESYRLMLEMDPQHYFERLRAGDYTVFLAKAGSKSIKLPDELKSTIAAYMGDGANLDALNQKDQACLAIGGAGTTIKALDNAGSCSLKGKLPGGIYYVASSDSGESSVHIDTLNFKNDASGLQVVAFDNELGCVVDSATFAVKDGAVRVSHDTKTGKLTFREALERFEADWDLSP